MAHNIFKDTQKLFALVFLRLSTRKLMLKNFEVQNMKYVNRYINVCG